MLADAIVEVDAGDWNPHRPVRGTCEPTVQLPSQVQDQEERSCEVRLEEGLWVEIWSIDGPECHVKLRNQTDDVDDQANVRSVDTHGSLVWNLVERVTLCLPSHSEADMRERNAAVDEEDGKT